MTQKQNIINLKCDQKLTLTKEEESTDDGHRINHASVGDLQLIECQCSPPKRIMTAWPAKYFNGHLNTIKNNKIILSSSLNELSKSVQMVLSSTGIYTRIEVSDRSGTTNHYYTSLQKVDLKDIFDLLHPFEQKLAPCVALRMFGPQIVQICNYPLLFSNYMIINIGNNYSNNQHINTLYNSFQWNRCREYYESLMNVYRLKDNTLQFTDTQLKDKQIFSSCRQVAIFNENRSQLNGKLLITNSSLDHSLRGYRTLSENTKDTAIYRSTVINTNTTNNSNINIPRDPTIMKTWPSIYWTKLKILLLYAKVNIPHICFIWNS